MATTITIVIRQLIPLLTMAYVMPHPLIKNTNLVTAITSIIYEQITTFVIIITS